LRPPRAIKEAEGEDRVYQGRVALSPTIEEQYKQLARNYDNASEELSGSVGE